jgi:hypothetical protein
MAHGDFNLPVATQCERTYQIEHGKFVIRSPVALRLQVFHHEEALNLKYLKGRRRIDGLCILRHDQEEDAEGQSNHSTEVEDSFSDRHTKRCVYLHPGVPSIFNLMVGTQVETAVQKNILYILMNEVVVYDQVTEYMSHGHKYVLSNADHFNRILRVLREA